MQKKVKSSKSATSVLPALPSKSIISLQTSPEASSVGGAVLVGGGVVSSDRVGNVAQKELAASEVGVTRRKYLSVIRELLEAVRSTVVYDSKGMASTVSEPDLDKRSKGAELAGKFFGDYKEHQSVGSVVHNKIVVQWLNAPLQTSRLP